jgi:hypothetical protein
MRLVGVFKVIQMTIDTRDSLLIVGCVRKVHAVFLMAIDTQGRNIITGFIRTCAGDLLQRSAMWVMAGGAVHAALVVR